jgi:hypothetical protein
MEVTEYIPLAFIWFVAVLIVVNVVSKSLLVKNGLTGRKLKKVNMAVSDGECRDCGGARARADPR